MGPVTTFEEEGGVRAGRIRRAGRSVIQGLANRLGLAEAPRERVRDIFRRRRG